MKTMTLIPEALAPSMKAGLARLAGEETPAVAVDLPAGTILPPVAVPEDHVAEPEGTASHDLEHVQV